jgi:hypothetical protein
MAGVPRESLDDWIERHVALGLLVTAGARMEEILRDCFCMLDGGEHADVVAAGQDVSWLIEYCGDLAEANPLITQASKDAIGAALTVCQAASQHRNDSSTASISFRVHELVGVRVGLGPQEPQAQA